MRTKRHRSKTKRSQSLMLMSLLALLFTYTSVYAQRQSVHQKRERAAVAIDCDTALTSDLRIVRRPYKMSDNIFWGLGIKGNRSLSPEARQESLFKMIRPGAEFMFGKYFSPWISASVNLGYNMQQESMLKPFEMENYSFHSVSLSLEAQLCLNRLFTRYNSNERFLVYALAGAGIQTAFAYRSKDTLAMTTVNDKFHFSPLLHAGAMFEWKVAEGVSVTLRGTWTTTTSRICGLGQGHRHQGVDISLGFVRRLPNHYASRSFQNCRGNEIYYFGALEDRLLADHKRQLKRSRKGKAEAPIMAAEEDSILIFPHGYAYLTPRQEAKLDRTIARLAGNPHLVAVFDIYPIVNDDPKMTATQAIQRCESAIRHYILHHQTKVNENQLRFKLHSDEPSPVADQSIWMHGAFIHYVQ